MNSKEERMDINFADLFKYIFGYWKIILISMIIFSIIFGLIGIKSSKKEKPESAVEVNILTADMTSEEKTDVEDAAKIINMYRAMYKTQKAYLDKSIFQNLDPYAIESMSLSYYIDNAYKVSYPIIAEQNKTIPIIQMYTSVLKDENFYKSLVENSELNLAPEYISELVKVNYGSENEEKEINDTGVFEVTIYANNADFLLNIAGYIEEALNEKTLEVVDLYGEHSLVLSSKVKETIIDTSVAKKQQDNLSTLTTITNSINAVESGFADDQLAYLKYLVHEELEEDTNIIAYFILGAIVGIAVIAAWYALKYLFSDSIKTENEFVKSFEIKSFGTISENAQLVAAKISNAVALSDSKRVAIITENKDDFKEILSLTKLEANIIVDLPNSVEAFDSLVLCDSVIIVVTLKETKRDYLSYVKSICADSNIKILGIVVK